MGEYDRNTICSPLPVQPPDDGTTPIPIDEDNKNKIDIIKYVAPPNARLVKGHKRVGLLIDDIDSSHKNSKIENDSKISIAPKFENLVKTKVFDIVLHNFESYLLPVELKFHDEYSNSLNSDSDKLLDKSHYRIKDYSEGWLHTLLVLEDL